jgi:hypothetical protein
MLGKGSGEPSQAFAYCFPVASSGDEPGVLAVATAARRLPGPWTTLAAALAAQTTV